MTLVNLPHPREGIAPKTSWATQLYSITKEVIKVGWERMDGKVKRVVLGGEGEGVNVLKRQCMKFSKN